MTKWSAVTTCNQAQWTAYGEAMAATFVRHWPREVRLTVYAEGFDGGAEEQFETIPLAAAAPWLAPWKVARSPAQCGLTPTGYAFRRDAVRFAHKIAAIGAAATELESVLIWLDADIVAHAPVTLDWLEALLPADADMGWLDRDHVYPECGFLMFRLPQAGKIIRQIVTAYQTGQIFKLREWHDSYVIETIVKAAETAGDLHVASLSGEGRAHHHVLANSPLAERLDHLKGKRKAIGRTPRHERCVAGGGAYWQ